MARGRWETTWLACIATAWRQAPPLQRRRSLSALLIGAVFLPAGVPIGVVRLDDPLNQGVPHDIGSAERVKIDARNVAENVPDLEQAALLRAWEVDLCDVTGHDHARVFAQAREEHHH